MVLVSQGVVQTFRPYQQVELLQPANDATGQPLTVQTIAVGPAASQVAIKQLGTNGGGFFNVNSAHPFENPTPLSNFLEMLAILLIPAALCYTFGKMVGDTRQGWAILAAMLVVFLPMLALCAWSESQGNPALAKLGVDQSASDLQAGGNMEGKEVRFGLGQFRLVGDGHHGRLQRQRQQHARLLHAAGRTGSHVDDATGGGHLRRRGQRAVRHADVRHRRRVRGRV